MKKVLVAVLAFAVLSVGMAQSFSVGGDYSKQIGVTAEYAHPVEFGSLLFGVRTVPGSWATEVAVGVAVRAGTFEVPEVLELTVPVRVHLPVYSGTDLILGQLAGSVGLDVYLPQDNGFGLFFGGRVQSNLNTDLYRVLPSVYGSIGVRYTF